jgi:WD40 repeat protein
VCVWDLSRKLVTELHGHQGAVISTSFSPDGKLILTASSDKTARVWDANGRLLVQLQHQNEVTKASFSPDGKRIFTASADGILPKSPEKP